MDNQNPPIPETRDAETCRQIIASLPITNVPVAFQTLHDLIGALYLSPPPATDYLSVLEMAREPLAFVQDTVAARYAAKPLPATGDETVAFERTVALWQLMADSYARVAQLGGGSPDIQKQLALVCQRCIYYAGQAVIEYYRGRRALAPRVWVDLHGYFDTAEDWHLATETVPEPLGIGSQTTNCAQTYAAVLLVDLSNPYSRTPRELSWIVRWGQALAPMTAVVKPDEEAGARGYGIDLMQDRGLLPVDHLAQTASARVFDTSRLGELVQTFLTRLKAGESPAKLGLGDDCPVPHTARLLVQLYRPWCLAAMPRRFERSKASGALSVIYDQDSIFFHVTGAEFVQPAHSRSYSRLEVEKLWTYRNQIDPAQPLNWRAAQLSVAFDQWQIQDESLNGFRVTRNSAGPRIEHGQLLAIKAPDKEGFHLGRVTWLFQETAGRLQAGIQMLPGPATGVAIRPTGLTVTAADKYVPGYLLPAVPALKETISLMLPPGWYVPGRILELFTDRPVSVRLGELLARGANFERCTFTLAT